MGIPQKPPPKRVTLKNRRVRVYLKFLWLSGRGDESSNVFFLVDGPLVLRVMKNGDARYPCLVSENGSNLENTPKKGQLRAKKTIPGKSLLE